jgi:hypothetical protein
VQLSQGYTFCVWLKKAVANFACYYLFALALIFISLEIISPSFLIYAG